ncbi:MAG: 50S ribosomal protein L6 [Elusimicrobiaceae bacterium]
MSRVGKKPITIPAKVKVTVNGSEVKAEGPLGKLEFTLPKTISATIDGNQLLVTKDEAVYGNGALFGTARARINNLVHGVLSGFEKVLIVNGLGYRAQVQGQKLNLELGFSHPVLLDIPAGVSVEYDAKNNKLIVKGADKALVGNFAASVRRFRLPEPYKGTGIRYEDEHVARKAGKAAATGKK